VLKVFIAPEFYFRSVYGGYTDMKYFSGEGAGRDPNPIVGGLANAVQDERWKDWLFVFGTSVVVAKRFISPETSNPDLSRKIAVLNTALVQQGYYSDENERTLKGVAVVKDYKSGDDFGDFPGVKFKNDDLAHFPAGPISYASEVNTPGRSGGGGYNSGSIFMLDNIIFGLEVCADRGMGRLRKATPSIISRPRTAVRSFFNDLAQHLLVEREIGNEFAQSRILFLELLQSPHFRRHQTAINLLPAEKCRLADPHLATDFFDARSELCLLQGERNLLFREP
jgi:hypothetical protein